MEAGLSLRRSPLLLGSDFPAEPRATEADASSNGESYESALTGDIDLHDRFVLRRPYVDRAFPHSKRRSQLILEQKFNQHRSAAASLSSTSEDDWNHTSTLVASSRSPASRRPGTAPHRPPVSPRTPDSASASVLLDFSGAKSPVAAGGLRELTIGAAAQPASKRASWTRLARESEARSDSHHSPNSSLLEAAAPIQPSAATSRRHSSFLTGDYRTATLMPIFANKSFEIPSPRADKRRSEIVQLPTSSDADQAHSPNLASISTSKRDSMLSTDSSATSSSKGEARSSTDNVEFEGDDAQNQAQSSASSGYGDDETIARKTPLGKPEASKEAATNVAEVFTTPRTSAEHETVTKSVPSIAQSNKGETVQSLNSAARSDASHHAKLSEATAADDNGEPVPAPAIVPSALDPLQTAVVPPTPPEPTWTPPNGESVSPTSSPSKTFRSLDALGESPRSRRNRSQASIERRPSDTPTSPSATLSIPSAKSNGSIVGAGRRGSSASVASVASSTSTYRIRRKPVPSDGGGDADSDVLAVSPQPSPAQQEAPLPSTEEEEGTHLIQHARTPSGSDFMRKAQEAAQAHMLAKKAGGSTPAPPPAKSSKRPSTALAATGASLKPGLGLGKQPFASASVRDLKDANGSLTASSSGSGPGGPGAGASRPASRATIKRPTTAPVGSAGQFRVASDATSKSVLEVEGLQFVLGKDDAGKAKVVLDGSPSVPNAVRFLQHQRNGSTGADAASTGHNSLRDSRRKSASTHDSHHSDAVSATSGGLKATSAAVAAGAKPNASAGGWGLEEEIKIADRVKGSTQSVPSPKPRPVSMDKGKKSLDFSAKSNLKNSMLMNIINEDESDEVKAAAREAGIPEGSYAIHPPSMLQLFEASQCLVYDQTGKEVIFGDLFKRRRTLVCFLRHWWCGFCQQFAMSIRHIDPLPLKKANMDFIIVGQGDWSVIKAYREVMQVPYPMFADPKRNVYRALGMTLRTNDANPVCARPDYASMSMTKGILVAIKKGLFDMPIRNPGDMKLLGGDFILGPGLQCSFTHRMTTADGHMDLPRILAQAGCDLSLKTPKPLYTVDEKEARAAMLAGGNQNRRQTRSLGRSRGKKSSKADAAGLDGSFGTTSGAGAAAAAPTGSATGSSRFARPSIWGRFPGRFSKSQASLPMSESMADLSSDFGPARGLSAGPRSASAMRKISYDGRVRDSFETQQTDIEFESRATSIDTRRRPSDASMPSGAFGLNKAQSMSELRKRFELGGLRSKSRQEPSKAKASLESHLTVPRGGANNLHHSVSTKSLRKEEGSGAVTPNGAVTPTPPQPPPKDTPTTPKESTPAPKQLSVFQNRVIAKADDAAVPATTGLGIATVGDAAAAVGEDGVTENGAATPKDGTPLAKSIAELSAPGSFLMDLDVYDSLSRQPSQKFYGKPKANGNGRLEAGSADSGLSPSQFSDGGFGQEAADADSDTEPSMSANASPARTQKTTPSSSSSGGSLGPSASASFYSFNTFRGKTNLEHLPEEADEDESDASRRSRDEDSDEDSDEEEEDADEEEDNDEPIQFEDGRSGLF